MIYYKIRNRKTGLFHKGGVYEVWSKEGKTWTTLGKLRSMLTMNSPDDAGYGGKDMTDWEIIEYEVTEKAIKMPHEVIDPKKIIAILKR
jgi:hypothetical protein